MIESPRITVVIPSLNVCAYIGKCIDSVLNQSIEDIEVFVIDAESSDGTYELIKEYSRKDERVQVIKDTKRSTGYAKNLGIEMSNSPYIAIVEPDDYIDPYMLETLYKKAEETDADIVKANYSTFIEEDDQEFVFPKSVSNNSEDYGRIIDPHIDKRCFSWCMFEWLGIYRKDYLNRFLIRHNESNGAAFQDTGFWFLSFVYARRVLLLNNYFYYYRKDNPNSSVKKSDKSWDIIREYEYIEKELNGRKESWDYYKDVYYHGFFHDNMAVYSRVDESYRMALLKHVRDRLLFAKKCGYLNSELYVQHEWERLNCLLDSAEKFNNMMTYKRSAQLQKQTDFIKDISKYKHVYIFGAGSYGNNLLLFFVSNGIIIDAFVDNDRKKRGKRINGIEIISVEDYLIKKDEGVILIPNRFNRESIQDDLIYRGISEKNTRICCIEDLLATII